MGRKPKKNKKSEQVNLRLEPETLKRLQARAEDEKRPVAQLARILLEQALDAAPENGAAA